MRAASAAVPPDTTSLRRLAESAAGCTACELYRDATQTVFGEGPRRARIMLVGEQPGDIEDREGAPFVGPAGRILDKALVDAGIERADTYVTNAVKHFRWKPDARGTKRRLHQRPGAAHVTACRPWLIAEARAVRPQLVVAMGAVASSALFGPAFRLTASRGQPLDWPGAAPFDGAPQATAFATIHPSAVLRAGPERAAMYDEFVRDLHLAAGHLG